MSAGNFETSRYETTGLGAVIMPIRIQPETAELTIGGTANAAPTGAVSLGLFVNSSGNNNAYGVKPRRVSLQFTGAPPDGYSGENVSVVVLTPEAAEAYQIGATGTYLGSNVEVVGITPERIR